MLCRQSSALAYTPGRLDGAPIQNGSEVDTIRRDPLATAPELLRAFALTWTALDLALHSNDRDKLYGPVRTLVDEMLADGPLDAWVNRLGGLQRQICAEIAAASRSGPLHRPAIDVEDLDRQLARIKSAPDAQVLRELENYALGDLADQFRHAGFPNLAEVVEPGSDDEDSVLLGVFLSFLHLAVDQSIELAFGETSPGVIPPNIALRIRQEFDPIQPEPASIAPPRFPFPHGFDVDARLRQGLNYAQRGDYERAVVEFGVALQHASTNSNLYFHRADAYRLKGDYERAIADYSAAIRIDPHHITAYIGRGTAYKLAGALEWAEKDFSQAVSLDAGNVAARLSRGAVLAAMGRSDAAIADYSEAVKLDPSHSWAYQSRADVYAGKGEHDLALADYGQALRLNPYFPLAYSNRGDVYRLKTEFERAIADYSEAIRLDQFNPRIYTSRGEAYRQKGQFDQALADFGEAIRLDPTNPSGYLNRGMTLQLAGEHDRAVADFDRAEQFDSSNPTIYYQRALAYQQQSSFERALRDLDRAVELNPRDGVAFLSRGNIYAGMRDFDRAIGDFTEAIRLNPKSEQAYLDRGTVLVQTGAFESALEDCAAALRLNPNLVPALLVRGGCQHKLGYHSLAVDEYNQAIQINPRYAKAYNDRGASLSKLGQLDEAVRDFTRAIELKTDYVQAIANRATAYQMMKRHDLALRDLTRAVTLDSKYAAVYCVQRSLSELARHHFDQALADCSVALHLDPQNTLARATKTEIVRLREQSFEIELGGVEPEPLVAEQRQERRYSPPVERRSSTIAGRTRAPEPLPAPEELVVLDFSDLVEEDQPAEELESFDSHQASDSTEVMDSHYSVRSQALPRQVADTQAVPGLETMPQVDSDGTEPEIVLKSQLASSAEFVVVDQTETEMPPGGPGQAENAERAAQLAQAAEAERLKIEREQKQLEIADKAKKLRDLHEQSAQRKKAKEKLTPEELEELAAERRKKIRNFIIIGIGFAVVMMWLWPVIWKMIPMAKPTTYTVDKFVAEFKKDRHRFEEKFVKKPVLIKGKLRIEAGGKGNPDRYWVEVPDGSDLKIEFRPADPEVEYAEGVETNIGGIVKPITDGKLIVVDQNR
jgi:tetratricopeptide (TPR) repeat protein